LTQHRKPAAANTKISLYEKIISSLTFDEVIAKNEMSALLNAMWPKSY